MFTMDDMTIWTPEWLLNLNFRGLGEVAFLILVISFVYNRLIKRSQAEQLVKGVFVVLMSMLGLWFTAHALHLPILEIVFLTSIFILLIGLIVIFQPELRRTLLFLGQGELFGSGALGGGHHHTEDRKPEHLIQELSETIHFLSKSKRGALIVLESLKNPGADYLEVGTALDAKLSTELLLTIFHPNTPLHDGAVIISPENRVTAAGVLLPLTENPELSWQYGTRHRAAIGLTEISDSRCLVVSEETGHVSLVYQGQLTRMENTEELKKALEKIYHVTIKPEMRRSEKLGKKLSGIFAINDIPNRLQKIFGVSEGVSTEKKSSEKKASDKLPKSGTNG